MLWYQTLSLSLAVIDETTRAAARDVSNRLSTRLPLSTLVRPHNGPNGMELLDCLASWVVSRRTLADSSSFRPVCNYEPHLHLLLVAKLTSVSSQTSHQCWKVPFSAIKQSNKPMANTTVKPLFVIAFIVVVVVVVVAAEVMRSVVVARLEQRH